MFPSFRSSGNPPAGVRTAAFPFISPIVPTTPKVTVLSKSKGGPYRHEVSETPTRAKTGEHGDFLDRPKPARGVRHALYAAPTRAVLPKPKPCDGDLTASERTSNILRNMDKMHWITSYQMHYQDLQQSCKMEDSRTSEMSEPPGRTSLSAPRGTERDRSVYVLVPSKLRQEARRRQGRNAKSTYADTFLKPSSNRSADRTTTCECDRAADRRQMVPDPPVAVSSGAEPAESSVPSRAESKAEAKVHFDENPAKPPAATNTRDAKRNLPRLRVLPGIAPVGRAGAIGEGDAGGLLGLQSSYSRSKAHRAFNSSINYKSLNLRDNVFVGKKHNFYGLNCNVIH
ncbi:uncharacterized protein LOC133501144 [Syngnathoides biaculeatus]|uniref:uncharacterized protein LOC133501144 n=1 Tax=Syngnathoides biaculeatus TaxID=300417 RepID=UPI002ADD9D5F|nr:uncharacterized protein LOC133501144 [Syngnathoides biaculeatus]